MSSRTERAKIAAEVADLQRQDGSYFPPDFVNWAGEHPKSALHSQFEWDNKKAGHAHRLWQARQIIKSYVVTMSDETPQVIRVISVPSLRHGEEGSYLLPEAVAGNEQYRQEVMDEVKMKLVAMRDRYSTLTLFARFRGLSLSQPRCTAAW